MLCSGCKSLNPTEKFATHFQKKNSFLKREVKYFSSVNDRAKNSKMAQLFENFSNRNAFIL